MIIFKNKIQVRGAWISASAGMTDGDQRGMAIVIMMIGISGTMLAIGLMMSVATVNRIKAGVMQLNSTKAYYASEAGAENILYKLRKEGKNFSGGGFGSSEKQIKVSSNDFSGSSGNNFQTQFSDSKISNSAWYTKLTTGSLTNKIRLEGDYNSEVQRMITLKY